MSFLQALRASLGGMLGDVGPLMPAVIGIIVYCFFYPLPYLPQTVRTIPVAVADADASPLSRELTRNLDATREVHVQAVTRNVDQAVLALRAGDVGGIITIPAGFERDVMRGTPTGITVMGNGAFIVLDGSLLGAAAGATAATLAQRVAQQAARTIGAAPVARAAREGPAFVKQPLFNLVQGYESYVVCASTALIVMQLLTIAISTAVGTWCEKGVWPVAPDGRLHGAAFAGMVAGFALIVFWAVLFWVGFVTWFHDLPRGGNLWGTVAFGALFSLTVAAFAVTLGAWLAERERALQFIAPCSIPALFMSGFALPKEVFSEPVRLLSLVFPTTPGIRGFLALNQMGASLEEVRPELLHMGVLCALFLVTAWFASARRIRSGAIVPGSQPGLEGAAPAAAGD